ncbi:MAG: biopolymer transporter ExbD [Persicimonas sp.]
MRRRREKVDNGGELNLAPFMNMVVILIPMLLLSVIFVSAGVVNVSSSKSSLGDESELAEDEPLDLTVDVSKEGFDIRANQERMDALEGCPEDGPTVCRIDEGEDLEKIFERVRRSPPGDVANESQAVLDEAMEAYDFRRLYNTLVELKRDHPDETRVKLTGEADVPYALLVHVMDVARDRLEEDHYDDADAFRSAERRAAEGGESARLFSDPVVAVAGR